MIVAFCSLINFRKDEVNYLNSDATWHTLLTMKCYDETDFRIHKFLPIVSLGSENDKFISWGATIPDKNGNFYYTSFSPAGYFLPYIFIKIFHLNFTEKSLYCFNSILLALSSVFWFLLLCKVLKNSKHVLLISFLGTMCFIFSPEIFHGMGIVYWHQSIMQVTLILQIFSFYCAVYENSKKWRKIFYLLCVINPYIEWTGYVANIGFSFAEFVLNWKNNKKLAVLSVMFIGGLTCLSFCIFSLHYISTVKYTDFFIALRNRFFARNIATKLPFNTLLIGYLASFKYIWLLFAVLIVWNIVQNGKIIFEKRILIFVLIFPCLENFIMIQHAVSYTYDRMKLSFVLSFLICVLIENILNTHNTRKYSVQVIFAFICLICAGNLMFYKKTPYIWKTDYRKSNTMFADFINENYSDSLLCLENVSVRGYINMLFGRGIYEWRNIEFLQEICTKKKIRYAIALQAELQAWNMYKIIGAKIIDVNDDLEFFVKIDNAEIITSSPKRRGIMLSSLSDENWTSGVLNSNHKVLLFNFSRKLLDKIQNSKYLKNKEKLYQIESVDFDENWIRLTVNEDATDCAYPTTIEFE